MESTGQTAHAQQTSFVLRNTSTWNLLNACQPTKKGNVTATLPRVFPKKETGQAGRQAMAMAMAIHLPTYLVVASRRSHNSRVHQHQQPTQQRENRQPGFLGSTHTLT